MAVTAPPARPVTAVVCCYADRREALVRRAVAGLRAQTAPPDQIVMVVDHSDALRGRLGDLDGCDVVANGGEQGCRTPATRGSRGRRASWWRSSTTTRARSRPCWRG